MAKLNFSIALGLAANNFKQGLSGVQNQLKGFASSVKSTFGMIAGAFAAGQIKAFAQECMNAYSAQLQAEQKLSVIMKQRMGVTDAEVKSVLKLASAQQELGVIGDEVQLAGAQQVATFLNEKKSLDSLIPAMNNLLAQQKGLNATQGDAVNIGNLMGKVMQGQTSALKRVGISFTEAEEKVLKFGTEQERAAMLAQVIKNNVGEMNAALAQTDAGKIQQMNNTLGDLKENIGKAIMPILGQLAPMISNFATNGANALVAFINTVQQNIQALVGFIVMQFAGIGLVKIFSQWLASYKTHSAQLEATASASTTKRLALEQRLSSQKIALLNLEAKEEEAVGKRKEAIAEQVTAKKKELAALEQQINAAKNAEIVAQEEASAFKTAAVWKKGMMMAKMSFVSFITTVKGLFRSFAPLLIFEILFTVGMKVYEMLSKNSKGFMALAKVVGGAVMSAISLLADGLAKIFDYVADLFGLVDKGGKKYRSKKTGKVYNSMEELNAAEGKGSKRKPTPGTGGGGGTGGGKITTTTTKEKTPAEQAAEDVAKAEKEYSKSIKKGIAAVDIATETYEEGAERKKAVINAQQSQISAIKTLYDTYSEAWAVTGNEGYMGRMKELMAQMDTMSKNTEGAAEELARMEEDLKKQEEFRTNFAKSLAKNKETASATRDTTFDYKSSKSEIVQAQLEFDLEKAKQQLEELKQYAESECVEALNEIEAAEATVQGLDGALKLEKVNQDIEDLKGKLSDMSFEAVQQGWGAIKSTVSDIQGLITTMEDPDATGWEKFSAAIDTVMGLMNTYMQIMETVNTIQKISTALTQAKSAATAADTTKTAANTAASTANTTAKSGEAVANATAEGAKQSFPLNIVAIALGVAAVVAALATSFSKGGIAGFSKGGIKRFAGGGTVAGMSPNGDFINARLNSGEMVLTRTQQSRLFRIANGESNGNSGPINLRMKVRGRDLISCEDNEARISALSGKRVNH